MGVETIGEACNLGWRVTMRCVRGKIDYTHSVGECRYVRDLEMETLVCTRGRGFPLAQLQSRLRCPRCGSRDVAVMFSPPGNSSVKRRMA